MNFNDGAPLRMKTILAISIQKALMRQNKEKWTRTGHSGNEWLLNFIKEIKAASRKLMSGKRDLM
jgi:hypothetical protein